MNENEAALQVFLGAYTDELEKLAARVPLGMRVGRFLDDVRGFDYLPQARQEEVLSTMRKLVIGGAAATGLAAAGTTAAVAAPGVLTTAGMAGLGGMGLLQRYRLRKKMEKQAATWSLNVHPLLLGLPNVQVATDTGDSRKIEMGVGLPPGLGVGRRFTGGLPLPGGAHIWPRLGLGTGGPQFGLSFKTRKAMEAHRKQMERKRAAAELLDRATETLRKEKASKE